MPILRIIALLTVLSALPCLAVPAPSAGEQGAPSAVPGLEHGDDAFTSPATRTVLAHYEALFGPAERRAVASSNPKEAAKFSMDLMGKVKDLADDPGVVRLAYEKAYEFGIRDPDGYASAAEAARQMITKTSSAQWHERLIAACKLQLRSRTGKERSDAADTLVNAAVADADRLMEARNFAEAVKHLKEASAFAAAARLPQAEAINERIKEALAKEQVIDKIARMDAKLAQNPHDVAARDQVINLYLTFLDDPAGAARYIADQSDESIRTLVLLARKDPKDLTEEQLVDLGRWYRRLSDRAEAAGKIAALVRSTNYLSWFLDKHESKDAVRLKVLQEADDVTKRLTASTAGTGAGQPNGDAIVFWNTHNFTANSFGSTSLNVALLYRGRVVWRQDNVPIEWLPDQDCRLSLRAPRVVYDKVRVEVTRWHGFAGGLSEIQVLRHEKNVVLNAKADASAAWSKDYLPSALTDGITTSGLGYKGYWLLPNGTPGWAEVEVPIAESK